MPIVRKAADKESVSAAADTLAATLKGAGIRVKVRAHGGGGTVHSGLVWLTLCGTQQFPPECHTLCIGERLLHADALPQN